MNPTKTSRITPWLCALLLLLLVACEPLPEPPRHVSLVVDGEERSFETELSTVRDLLADQNVTLGELDRVTPPESAALRDAMVVTVVRVAQVTETFTETVAFGRQVMRDANVTEGESRLLQSGEPGVLTRVYRTTLEDGIQTARVLVQETITEPPQDEIILVGTRPTIETVTITGTLAYLSSQDAYRLRGSNRAPRRLTTLGDLDGRVFTLSPDATQLLFTRAVTEAAHINELWLVRTTEASPNPIPLNVDDVLWADWDAEGERIAWTTMQPVEEAPGWRGMNDLWIATLTVQNVLISRREALAADTGGSLGWWGTRYAWSPDGRWLAYARPDGVGVVNPRTREQRPLLTFPVYRTYSSWAWNPTVAWSPDSSTLATVIHGPAPTGGDPEESPVFDVWAIEATGAYSAELASEVGMWSLPQFAPVDATSNRGTLLFGRATIPYQSEISPYTLFTIDRDGSGQTGVYTPEEPAGIELPSWHWSPDGESVAFVQRGGIVRLTLADGGVVPLVDDGSITQLDWR